MKNKKKILITGGSGFIGSAIIRQLLKKNISLLNIDCLSYASNKKNLLDVEKKKGYKFLKLDISNKKKLEKIFKKFKPDYVINCAAETHVDRSIISAKQFIKSNIIGTYNMLECTKDYSSKNKKFKRFHQISTDEVFGDLHKVAKAPDENSPYIPSSPYSASKASSDHLVTSWGRTYKIPYSISICTNNYGPRQFPEKLIPKTIINAMKGKKIPIYGDGKQIRDWLFVEDHAIAVEKILFNKKTQNNKFNISGNNQIYNINLVNIICDHLNKKIQFDNNKKFKFQSLIEFVKDRPGHDKKYFLNSSKIRRQLKWKPNYNIKIGIEKTIDWYLKNLNWWKNKKF